jgi:hypothetical protein
VSHFLQPKEKKFLKMKKKGLFLKGEGKNKRDPSKV